MEDLTVKGINKIVDDIIKNNQDEIMKGLLSGTD